MGQICPIVFLAFQTFSPGLENQETSKCISESFKRMVTHFLCVENCQSYILTHSCLLIVGRLFYNVKYFKDPGSESATYGLRVLTRTHNIDIDS